MIEIIDSEYAREALDYDPTSGELYWRHRPQSHFRDERHFKRWNSRYALMRAGVVVQPHGYIIIKVNYRPYRAHRLAWLITHGTWPHDEIDHINGIRTDNRLVNIREATRRQNEANKRISKSNKSGVKGVSWNNKNKKWVACIKSNSRKVHLGYFDSINDAASAYACAARDMYGEFSNVG